MMLPKGRRCSRLSYASGCVVIAASIGEAAESYAPTSHSPPVSHMCEVLHESNQSVRKFSSSAAEGRVPRQRVEGIRL